MIIETKLEFDNFLEKYQDSSCILIPVLCDVNKHPLENSLCLLYVKVIDGDEYILPFNHSEAINIDISYTVGGPDSMPIVHGIYKFMILGQSNPLQNSNENTARDEFDSGVWMNHNTIKILDDNGGNGKITAISCNNPIISKGTQFDLRYLADHESS